MSLLDFGLLGLLALAAGFLVYRLGIAAREYRKFRGERIITCPENHQPAAVAVAAGKAARRAFTGTHELRLKECSRWPEREGCGQDCLSEIEADPEQCLVWNIVNDWYADKVCAYCGKPFGHINWHDHRPALLNQERRTVQWTAVPPEKLPEIFRTHQPVCWDCHIAESFRREHPEMVTDRSPH